MMPARNWHIPLWCSAVATVLWWLHIVLTWLFPPFKNIADYSCYAVVSVCKLVVLIYLPLFVLPKVFSHLHSNRRRALVVFVVWFVPLVVYLGTLSLLRDPLAMILNNDAIRFWPTFSSPELNGDSFEVGFAEFLSRWKSGAILLREVASLFVALATIVSIGFYGNRRPTRAGITTAAVGGGVVILSAWALKLFVLDYDVFLAGSLMGPLALDIAIPFVAIDPLSEIGLPVYTWLIWSSFFLTQGLRHRRTGTTA
jgi:hypothetical protein